MLTGRGGELLSALQERFPSWDRVLDGDQLAITRHRIGVYRPPRRSPSWATMLSTLQTDCAENGITRADPLPLRGLDDAELTFSAVQAIDPYVKHRQRHTYGRGLFFQPVVRFTGKRDEHGALLPGFLTSFVNTSIVQPIDSVDEHTTLIDTWLGMLCRLGLHTQHLAITGSLTTWRRGPVAGITLRIYHEDTELGDAVLLWNTKDPSRMATDIGSGLERLRWILTRRPWPEVVYGDLAWADPQVLDAVRTATLIVGSGINPSPRGPGSAVRRLLRAQSDRTDRLGLSRVVRWAHEYWSRVAPLPIPWHEVCRVLDAEVHTLGRTRW